MGKLLQTLLYEKREMGVTVQSSYEIQPDMCLKALIRSLGSGIIHPGSQCLPLGSWHYPLSNPSFEMRVMCWQLSNFLSLFLPVEHTSPKATCHFELFLSLSGQVDNVSKCIILLKTC